VETSQHKETAVRSSVSAHITVGLGLPRFLQVSFYSSVLCFSFTDSGWKEMREKKKKERK
jgi:hypothetical protein